MSHQLRIGLFVFAAVLPAVAPAQTTVLNVNGTQPGGTFGAKVTGLGDVNADGYPDFAVGSPGAPNGGLVAVHSGFDGSVINLLQGTGPTGFGGALADAGDVDGDGVHDLFVGTVDLSTGAATLFSGSTGSPLYNFVTGVATDGFGSSVAGAGDVDHDGIPDLIVGGFSAATVFSGATGQLLFTVTLGGFTIQGLAVAAAGDVNNDGFGDILVGDESAAIAPGIFSGGVVRIFAGPSGTPIRSVGGPTFEFLGRAVASIGDVTGDGVPDFVVGAPQALGSTGLARIYSGQTGAVVRVFSSPASSLQFGWSVADAGDLNGDGFHDVIVGGIGSGPLGNFPGTVVVYSGVTGTVLATINGGAYDRLGYSVASAGDLTGDQRPEIILGAPSSGFGGPPGYALVVTLSSIASASVSVIGTGCGAGPFPPVLALSGPPVLGQTTTISVTLATPLRSGAIFVTLPPAVVQPVGGGCTVYLSLPNIASWLSIPIATGPAGDFNLPIPLASIPTLAGSQLAMQAAVLPTAGPLGLDLTNALVITLGF